MRQCEGCEDEKCQECCAHFDLENGHCIDCGLDLSEKLGDIAFERWKNQVKYGDN